MQECMTSNSQLASSDKIKKFLGDSRSLWGRIQNCISELIIKIRERNNEICKKVKDKMDETNMEYINRAVLGPTANGSKCERDSISGTLSTMLGNQNSIRSSQSSAQSNYITKLGPQFQCAIDAIQKAYQFTGPISCSSTSASAIESAVSFYYCQRLQLIKLSESKY